MTEPPADAGFLRGFLAGLTKPTLTTALASAALAALLLVGLVWMLRPTVFVPLAVAVGLDRSEESVLGFTVDGLRLTVDPPAPGAVIVLGASDVAQALGPFGMLADALRIAEGRPVEVRDLSFGGMTFFEMLAALDALPEGFRGTVVFGTSLERLGADAGTRASSMTRRRPGFDSPFLRAEVRRRGGRVEEMTPLESRVDFFRRTWKPLAAAALFGVREEPRPRLLREPAFDPEKEQRAERYLANLHAAYRQEGVANFQTLGRAMDRLRSRTAAHVVFLDGPREDARYDRFAPPDLRADFEARMARFVVEHDVDRLRIDDEARLTTEDFADWCHLRRLPAMERYTTVLARRLAELRAARGVERDR